VRAVLFVGAGHHQRRAIERARELGFRTVAVDTDPEAAGLAAADAPEVLDFTDVAAVTEVGRRHAIEGVLTVFADRAVPVVAAVAEELGLPGIGRETAHLMTHKIAMRRRLAEHGVAQPEFAAVRTLQEGRTAVETIGLPAVLKPASNGGKRGLFLLRYPDELEAHLHSALAASPTQEAIVERFHDGLELNGLTVARGGHVELLTLSDRLRPPGQGFVVGWMHVFPTTLFGDALAQAEDVAARTVHALGLRDGIALTQLLASDDEVRVTGVAACIPGGELARLVEHGVGIDLVEIALRQALGEEVRDALVRPRFQQPVAIRFLTAEPGPLATGTVRRIGSLEKVLAFPGVAEADTYLSVGETINSLRADGDRHGYVIATGDTNLEALDRAGAAARLVDVEVW
jgi:biotin carboxylase